MVVTPTSPSYRLTLFLLAGAVCFWISASAAVAGTGLCVDAAEAEAALRILKTHRAGDEIQDEAWNRLFSTDGYRRLGERERSMDRPFGEEQFRALLSAEEMLERAPRLEATLAAWKKVDFGSLAARILDYLPRGARLQATIYPMIKPQTNSFVFDLDGDPAIFLYLDPEVTPEKFANTVLHELHHIGFGGSCPPRGVEAEIDRLPQGQQRVLRWLGAFGEGFAMLAAAGGPAVHPHAESSAEERRRWDRDVARFEEDRKKVEAFFLDLLAGRLDDAEELRTARSFYGTQGPWYTVGWKMAVTVERQLGREALIEAFCDPRVLLSTYNRSAEKEPEAGSSPWPPELLFGSAQQEKTGPTDPLESGLESITEEVFEK